jgi:hypothetical protein
MTETANHVNGIRNPRHADRETWIEAAVANGLRKPGGQQASFNPSLDLGLREKVLKDLTNGLS